MNDLHNPIARIIERLQERWYEATSRQPDYKLIRWTIRPDDAGLINGFYQLESSPYGRLPDFFLVLLTPFKDYTTYARELLTDWLTMWEQDQSIKQAGLQWDSKKIRNRLEQEDKNPIPLLAEVLGEFQEKFCREDQSLVFGLLPHSVSDRYDFNVWLSKLIPHLPTSVKISMIDHTEKNYLKEVFEEFSQQSITLPYEDTGLDQAARQMATGGNSDDPEVGFRKCMFEMADGAASKDMDHICKWGDKALQIALKSGSKSFLATGYLIYAGFLLQLKKEEADRLLDEGLRIAEDAYRNGDKETVNVLLQLYGYKSAWHRIKGRKTKSCRWIFKQAQFAVENQLGAYAISICKMSARIAKSAWEDLLFEESVKLGYLAGEELTVEELKMSEIGTMAWHYAELLRANKEIEEATRIYSRMEEVLGTGWDAKIVKITDKHGQTVPDINETIESMNLISP